MLIGGPAMNIELIISIVILALTAGILTFTNNNLLNLLPSWLLIPISLGIGLKMIMFIINRGANR